MAGGTNKQELPRTLEGWPKFVKYAVFVANFVILICGIAVFSVGVWTLYSKSFMERLLGSDLYVNSAYILIITGVIVSIISFLGCLGAVKEIKCMLMSFFIILFLIFLILLVGGILCYVFRNDVEKRLKKHMLKTVPQYKNDTGVTNAWDMVQEKMKCCGAELDSHHGYEIWSRNLEFIGPIKVPKSCCKENDTKLVEECQKNPEKRAFEKGCYHVVKDFVMDHALLLGGIAIGISIVLVMGMILSCALFFMIK